MRGGFWSVLLVLSIVVGCGDDEPELFCDVTSPCPAGMTCFLPLQRCYTADLGVDASAKDAGDIGVRDLEAGGPDRGINGVKCSGAGTSCQSGICVDGTCCDKACTGSCEACDLSGKEGACGYVTADTDPAGECLGDAACGGDMCDGAGQCTGVKTTGTVCKAVCSTPLTELNESKCDAKGKCLPEGKATDCLAYKCVKGSSGVLDACGKSCVAHGDCELGGACDRTKAHVAGGGVCIEKAKVKLVADVASLTAALVAAGAGTTKSHILLSAASYKTNLTLNKGTAIVVGKGASATKLVAKDLLKPVVSVGAGAKMVLQGLAVSGTNEEGVKCFGGSTQGILDIYECEVKSNLKIGVSGAYCDVELRRNRITGNGKGGVELLKGKFTVVNNLVDGNGANGSKSGSDIGGLSISPASGKTVVFSNNTLANNLAKHQKWAGIRCSGISAKLENSIVWSKYVTDKLATTTGCTFKYSDVQNYTGGTTNLNEDPKFIGTTFILDTTSNCINTGPATTSHTKLDILGNPRPKPTTKVDMGAYETL